MSELMKPSQRRTSARDFAEPSVADAYLYVVLRWAHGKQVDLSGQDHLAAFFKRMQENSGVQAALKAEGLE